MPTPRESLLTWANRTWKRPRTRPIWKLQRIRDIRAVGLEVGHVVHGHGIDREEAAYEVEAALIDAYPGLTNRAGGHGSGDYGSRHVEEIIAQYAAEEFEVNEPLMLIFIGTYYQRDSISGIYDAVRCAWRVNRGRIDQYKLVLAHMRGLVVGAFRPEEWLPATRGHFLGLVARLYAKSRKSNG